MGRRGDDPTWWVKWVFLIVFVLSLIREFGLSGLWDIIKAAGRDTCLEYNKFYGCQDTTRGLDERLVLPIRAVQHFLRTAS